MRNKSNHSIDFRKNALLLFAAKFFPALSVFLIWMFYSKHLSMNAYGHFQAFWIQIITVSGIALLGFPVFILTYPPERLNEILKHIFHKRKILVLSVLMVSALLTGCLQSFYNQVNGLNAGVFFLLYICVQASDALLTAYRSFRWVIGLNIAYAVCFWMAHWLVYRGEYHIESLIYALNLLAGIKLLFSLFCIQAVFQRYEKQSIPLENATSTERLWWQLGLHDSIQMAFRWIDKFLLSFLLSKELYAVYVNATLEIAFLPLIFTAVSSAAIQHWAQHHRQQTQEKITVLHYSSAILSSVVFPLFFFLMFFGKAFLVTLFSEKYLSGISIFLCAQLVLPVRAFPFMALLQNLHRGDLINKGAIIDFILACILMYPLYYCLGLPGIALSFVISTYWQAAYYLKHSARILGKNIRELLPVSILLRKFIGTGIMLGITYLMSSRLQLEWTAQFWTGILATGSIAITGLYKQWRQGAAT